MSIAQVLKEHGQLSHGTCNLHIGELALEEDSPLWRLCAFVVQRISKIDFGQSVFNLGRRRWRRRCCRRCCRYGGHGEREEYTQRYRSIIGEALGGDMAAMFRMEELVGWLVNHPPKKFPGLIGGEERRARAQRQNT